MTGIPDYHHVPSYWQDGTEEYDVLWAIAVQADGSILLAGYTEGDWDGISAGGYDFIMVALSADGEELWRWQVTRYWHSFRKMSPSLPLFGRHEYFWS